jgi:small subunit ribosomal protein S27Ae
MIMADEKKKAPSAAKKKEAKKPKAYKPGKFCPKCGAGIRLAEHKDRRSCGKCGYFEKK